MNLKLKNDNRIDVTDIPQGVYTLSLSNQEGFEEVKKIIIADSKLNDK